MSGIGEVQRPSNGAGVRPAKGSGQGDAVDAGPPAKAADDRPPTRGDEALTPQRGAPSRFSLPAVAPAATPQPVASYGETFGSKSYVKDGSDPAMLGLMSRAVAANPELANGPLGQAVSKGHVGPQEVQALQTFLQSKGYSVGSKGVDGKFGPDTHAALAGLLTGAPPTAKPGGDPKPADPAPIKDGEAKTPPAGAEARTAVYDVSSGTVTLPDGTKLEAHSGLGANQDNPASQTQRNRGTTPTGLYKLTPREARFHGTAALRLTPIAANTHGRDGFLAHNYMLGPKGESHGCVVFKNYPAFLKAYNSGQINQIRVVP